MTDTLTWKYKGISVQITLELDGYWSSRIDGNIDVSETLLSKQQAIEASHHAIDFLIKVNGITPLSDFVDRMYELGVITLEECYALQNQMYKDVGLLHLKAS
ncbi:MAG: hypothetical protein VKJ46_02265 [Leptolyngbyaceae bacterium]|nr:hypothetical protein [Leptolyngbyaceae bacterium]